MATTKKLQTLVQLQQREGMVFEVLGNLTELPSWFHAEYLRSPKAVQLEAWLVETIFGPDGAYIPHVECVTRTLLHLNHWNPEGDAEILIFGRPYYQQDVSEMIMNLANHFRQLQMQKNASAQKAKSQQFPEPGFEDEIQESSDLVPEDGTQRPPEAAWAPPTPSPRH
uniref:KH domain containing 3-like protein n=1 Tax=Castor fiber TaxID=10185 RepID=A0A1U9WT35_CASFI|nr:KH domain containing 3-like protein [Castor fiber]